MIFLLPVFFAYSGLKTQVGLLNNPELWLLCAAILGVAIVGKYVGTYYAARSCNIDKQEASALGWLMNTRGLTELIVLNIGLELGVISPILFTMLVIMALVTTFMTSPLLEWTYPKKSIRLQLQSPQSPSLDDSPVTSSARTDRSQIHPTHSDILTPTGYRILVPVANPNTQTGLLQLATSIAQNDRQSAIINPLSLIELEEDYLFQSTPFEANRLIDRRLQHLNELIDTIKPQSSQHLNELTDTPEPTAQPQKTTHISSQAIFQPLVQIGYDVAQKTAVIAALDRADLVLLGWHRPTFTNNRLGGRVAQMLGTTPADVAVFIDASTDRSSSNSYQRLLVPYTANHHDDLAVEIALRMLWNDRQRQLKLIQITSPEMASGELSREIQSLLAKLPTHISSRIEISTLNAIDPIVKIEEISRQVDLTITGIGRTWGRRKPLLDRYTDRLAIHCVSSLLIARRYSQFGSHLSFALDDEP